MLHKSKSNKRNALKMALILPALAVFLLSFNTRTIYVPKTNSEAGVAYVSAEGQKTVQILINKDTTDEELEEIKKDLTAIGIDFSYTVVHNSNKEIIDIKIDMRSKEKDGKKFRGSSSFDNDGKPIDPITIVYDEDNNSFFMGDSKSKHEILHEKTEVNTRVYSDDKEEKHIEIRTGNGKEIIIINGKEVSREQLDDMEHEDKIHGKHVRIEKKYSTGDNSHVIIVNDSAEDMHVISEKGNSYFYMDSDDDKDLLYIIDGKEAGKEDLKSIGPDKIETIDVIKGDKAIEKYGEKAKDGVIEVKTKKED